MSAYLGLIGFLVFTTFGISQIYAGFIGIEYLYGSFWAGVAVFIAVTIRFTIPMTIGAFVCALKVWGWHWFFAAIFTAPGLLFIMPGMIASAFSLLKRNKA